MKSRRILFLLLFAIVVIAGLIYGLKPRPMLVDIDAVTRGKMQVTIEEEGKTRVRNRYVVSAPVAGIAQRINLDVGDAVGPARVITRLEPLRSTALDPRSRAEAEARVAAANAAISTAEESVASSRADDSYWEAELARRRTLLESGDIARDSYEQAETNARKARAELSTAERRVEQARRELEVAKAALSHSPEDRISEPAAMVSVRSPVSGRVLRIHRKSEGVVSAGEPLIEVGNARSLEVEVEVLSSDAVQLATGTRVLLDRWGGDHPLEAVVRLVEPVAFTKVSALGVEEQRVLVIVDITAPEEEWKSLGDQYRVEARFVLWEDDGVLQIPTSSLFRYDGGWAAFRVSEGVAQRRVVQVGKRSGLATQIASGLDEGDRVIGHPSEMIEDGAPIQVRGEEPQ